MNCERVRQRLLEADPAELRAGTDSPLGVHLGQCSACAALAARIVAAHTELDRSLTTLSTTTRNVAPQPRAIRPRWPRVALLAPLAAAAVLALVITRDQPRRAPPAERAPGAPAVNATASGGVAVIQTSNPDITVFWTF